MIDERKIVLKRFTIRLTYISMTHLVILVHGLHGSPSDFDVLRKRLSESHPTLRMHSSQANSGWFATHDGVEQCGTRLAKEVEQLLLQQNDVREIR
jgi:hypothetical protein